MLNKKGNVVIISTIFIAIILIIFVLIVAIYIGTINSLVHDIKLDMYSINKSAIISVNKGRDCHVRDNDEQLLLRKERER